MAPTLTTAQQRVLQSLLRGERPISGLGRISAAFALERKGFIKKRVNSLFGSYRWSITNEGRAALSAALQDLWDDGEESGNA